MVKNFLSTCLVLIIHQPIPVAAIENCNSSFLCFLKNELHIDHIVAKYSYDHSDDIRIGSVQSKKKSTGASELFCRSNWNHQYQISTVYSFDYSNSNQSLYSSREYFKDLLKYFDFDIPPFDTSTKLSINLEIAYDLAADNISRRYAASAAKQNGCEPLPSRSKFNFITNVAFLRFELMISNKFDIYINKYQRKKFLKYQCGINKCIKSKGFIPIGYSSRSYKEF